MEILITSKTTKTPGPTVKIDCPACGGKELPAITVETEEKNSLFWIIPLFTSRFVSVSCSACGKTFRTALKADQLAQIGREEISRHLAAAVPFLAKFCVVMGITLAVIPFLGLIFALIGIAFTMTRSARWKIAAIVGLVLSLSSTGILTVALLMDK